MHGATTWSFSAAIDSEISDFDSSEDNASKGSGVTAFARRVPLNSATTSSRTPLGILNNGRYFGGTTSSELLSKGSRDAIGATT